jgi:predicted transcriptional regulator
MEKTTVGVKLEPELRKRLKDLGKQRSRSTHWLMKEAIRRFLEDEEAAERAKMETFERWSRFEATGKYVENEDVTSWLKSWGSAREKPWPKTRK